MKFINPVLKGARQVKQYLIYTRRIDPSRMREVEERTRGRVVAPRTTGRLSSISRPTRAVLDEETRVARTFDQGFGREPLVKVDMQGTDCDLLTQSRTAGLRPCYIVSKVQFSELVRGSNKFWTRHVERMQRRGLNLRFSTAFLMLAPEV